MINIPYIHTKDGVTLFFDNENLLVSNQDPDYWKVVKLLSDPWATEFTLREAVAPVRDRLVAVVLASEKDGFTFEAGVIKRNGEPLNAYLTAKIERMVDQNWDLKPIAAFLDRLALNPSYRVVNDLYSFLEYGNMPITPDGYFLAYKYVRSDFMDQYSGKFDNSPGKTCTMPRNQVNEDRNQTCSAGLHVCSFSYLPHFGIGSNHRIVIVKVDPKDVVAIPSDYNNTKMRVSEYVVLNEITQRPQGEADILAQRPVFDDSENFGGLDWDDDGSDDDDDFAYEDDGASYSIVGIGADGFEVEIDTSDSLTEAKEMAYDLFQNWKSIRVKNLSTDALALQLTAFE